MAATVREFVQGFSRATGEDESACAHVARELQKNGLLPVGKSGRGRAPEITLEQAFLFILGYCGPEIRKEAARAANVFSQLVECDEQGRVVDGGKTLIERLLQLPEGWVPALFAGRNNGPFSIEGIELVGLNSWPEASVLLKNDESGASCLLFFKSPEWPGLEDHKMVFKKGGGSIQGVVLDTIIQLHESGAAKPWPDAEYPEQRA